MHFCPLCGNILLIEDSHMNGMRYCCPTCAYCSPIDTLYTNPAKLPLRKQMDDVLGGSDAWDNVDRTEAKCPFCPNNDAFFMQIQIRSADEPMTTFYKCTSCKKQWNDR